MRAVLLSLLLLQTVPTYLETLDVTVGNVDVVVTDKAGRPVSHLRREDFDIRENGAPQAITNFTEYGASSGVIDVRGTEERRTEERAVVGQPPPRKFVFFVDEMTVHPISRQKLLDEAHRFIETQMRPGDEGLILTRANAATGTVAFNGDRGALDGELRSVIEKCTFRTDTPSRAEQFFFRTVVLGAPTEEAYRQMARIYAGMVNRRVTGTLRSLLGVVGSMTQMEGKKVLVVMTESLPAEPGREAFTLSMRFDLRNPNVTPDAFSGREEFVTNDEKPYWYDARPMIKELGARAAANGITMYSIQPDPGILIAARGLDASQGAPKVSPLGLLFGQKLKPTAQTISSAGPAVSSFDREIAEGTATTLGALADATGGKYWIGEQNLDDAFRTMASDIDSYYSIGYRVADAPPNAIRKVDVTVKGRPDLVVRTRRDVLRYSPEREMDEIAAAALLTTSSVNELGIEASAAKPVKTKDAYKVDVAVKIPLEKLTFIPRGDKYEAQFTVHYAAADGSNSTIGEMREQTLRVPAEQIDAVRAHRYTYTSTLMVAAGTARISVGVYDRFSRLSGFRRVSVVAR